MAGLDPAIHGTACSMDARIKSGHDMGVVDWREVAARAACVRLNADKLLYLYEIDQMICAQLIPIERSLI